MPSGISMVVYDEDEKKKGVKTKELIGRTWIVIKPNFVFYKIVEGDFKDENVEIIYQRPKWSNIIYDATDDVTGKLLYGFSLIKSEDKNKVKKNYSQE